MRSQAKFYIVIYKTKPIHYSIKFLMYKTHGDMSLVNCELKKQFPQRLDEKEIIFD